jgi:protoporphyrin/coproporphyrin ferrochelatase
MTERMDRVDRIKKQGVLLVNLGTPDAPTAPAVKRFLSEFLHDHRVVDMSRWLWCPLLHGIILPIRVPKVAKLYQSVWMDDGSPLMVYSIRQRNELRATLDCPVELGMTYGTPSLKSGVEALMNQGVDSIVVLPLYPQYSATTTGAVYDAIGKALRHITVVPELRIVRDYCQHPLYIKALAQSVRNSWKTLGRGEYLLCSYHGIPKRYADNGDIYPTHCLQTTRLLAIELGLNESQIGMTYQSRFGREEWLQPYTDKTLQRLPAEGIKNIDVISPAFAVDCLETLEEISEQCREIFLHAGGTQFKFIPCLNDSSEHIELFASLVTETAVSG